MNKVFVFEGWHDIAKFKAVFPNNECVQVNGASVNREVTNYLKSIADTSEIYIITDPDSAGERIRRILNQQIPNSINIYLEKEDCFKNGHYGFEHLSLDKVRDLFKNYSQNTTEISGNLSKEDLLEIGLIGKNSKLKRDKIFKDFSFYAGSSKSLLNILNKKGITYDDLRNLI